MGKPLSYRPVFSDLAAEFLIALPKRHQRQLMQRARELAAHPLLTSDYVEQDIDGRAIEHLVTGDYVFAYWVDHATRSVFVAGISGAQ